MCPGKAKHRSMHALQQAAYCALLGGTSTECSRNASAEMHFMRHAGQARLQDTVEDVLLCHTRVVADLHGQAHVGCVSRVMPERKTVQYTQAITLHQNIILEAQAT